MEIAYEAHGVTSREANGAGRNLKPFDDICLYSLTTRTQRATRTTCKSDQHLFVKRSRVLLFESRSSLNSSLSMWLYIPVDLSGRFSHS